MRRFFFWIWKNIFCGSESKLVSDSKYILWTIVLLADLNFLINWIFTVPGGWREEEYTKCQGICGAGMKSKSKYCDSPKPSQRLINGTWYYTSEKCPCDSTVETETEIYCDGLKAIIDRPCNAELCKYSKSRDLYIHTIIL